MSPTDISTFATTQLALLDLELQAELSETNALVSQTSPTALQRAGAAIVNLQIGSQRTGLGGKTVLDLELDPAVGGGDIPEHGIRVGDIVGVQEQPSGSARKKEKSDMQKKGVEGVVLKVTPVAVSVALDKDEVEVPGGKLWLCVVILLLWRVVSLRNVMADCMIVLNLLMILRIKGMLELCACVHILRRAF
jgi:DNA polymerase alpha-associated DNA helicase A